MAKVAKKNTSEEIPVKVTKDAAGKWLFVGDKERGQVCFGPFDCEDQRIKQIEGMQQ